MMKECSYFGQNFLPGYTIFRSIFEFYLRFSPLERPHLPPMLLDRPLQRPQALLIVRGVSNSTAISKFFDVKFVYLGFLPVDLTAERLLLLLRLDLFNVLKRLLGFLDDLGSDLNGF